MRGVTQSFTRQDRDEPVVQIHACTTCHSTTHWTLTATFKENSPDADRLGVNMRLFDHDQLIGIELRFPDGAAWSGEGDYDYRRAPICLGAGDCL